MSSILFYRPTVLGGKSVSTATKHLIEKAFNDPPASSFRQDDIPILKTLMIDRAEEIQSDLKKIISAIEQYDSIDFYYEH